MTPARFLLAGLFATYLFWLGFCLVVMELHARKNIERGRVAAGTGSP